MVVFCYLSQKQQDRDFEQVLKNGPCTGARKNRGPGYTVDVDFKIEVTQIESTHIEKILNKVDEYGFEYLTDAERETFLGLCRQAGLIDTDAIRDRLELDQEILEEFDKNAQPGDEIDGVEELTEQIAKAEEQVNADTDNREE